ncbi:MAG: ABC-three component system protein [Candidatus Acidiferrales bacterium]
MTQDQAVHGPPVRPQQRILLYSADEWELFVQEWAHFCLRNLYAQVQRFSGAGDRGIDIAGFRDAPRLQGAWDNYQCKHYARGLYPSDAWPEVGKILWYSFKGEYKAPRRYFFVAPRGAGTSLANLLANPAKLKEGLIKNWDTQVARKITETERVALEGPFLAYVSAFDFSIFEAKTALQLIEDHRACPYHAVRFGVGLPPRPAAARPPEQLASTESRYVAQLLAAYADHKKTAVSDVQSLRSWPNLNEHFGRQREAFYHAESLRVFARDTVPAGTFESLQDDIHSGVIDVCEASHPDGFVRVRSVTKAARELQLTSNALLSCAKPKDRDGVCHQLANEDRLQWTKP